MATAAQVKALFESYKNGDDARFKAIATQIMAYEKNKGNTNFAKDLDDLIKGFSKRIDNKISSTSKHLPITSCTDSIDKETIKIKMKANLFLSSFK